MTRRGQSDEPDGQTFCDGGDAFTILGSRPLCKLKRWRLVEIVEKAK